MDVFRDPASGQACDAFLAELLPGQKNFLNFGVVNPDGSLRCSALPFEPGTDFSAQSYVSDTLKNRDFSVGSYLLEPTTNRPKISFGYPVYGTDGQLNGVLFASLSLEWLNDFSVRISLPSGATLMLLDRNGVVVVREPWSEEWIGRDLSNSSLFARLRTTRDEGSFEDTGLDGVSRLYGFTALYQKNEVASYVLIGFSERVLYQEALTSFSRNLILLIIATIASVLTA